MSQAKIGNFLFAAGGYDENYMSCARVFRYDPMSREWTEVAMMSVARVSFGLCSSDKRLYAVGGVLHTIGNIDDGGEDILSAVEMYNPEENAWKMLAKLPFAMFDHAAVFSENNLYVSGGISALPQHTIPMNSMFCLEDGGNEWTPLPDMTITRQGHSMTAHNGKIYILGGYTKRPNVPGFDDCENNDMFDIETKQWTTLTSTPESFGHLYRHVALTGNTIFFLCNLDSDVYLSSFDTEKQEFKQGVLVGTGVQKVNILQVPYPH